MNLDAYEELVLKTLEDCLRLSYTVDLVLRDVSTKGSCFSPPPDTKKAFWSYFCFRSGLFNVGYDPGQNLLRVGSTSDH